MKRVVGGCLVAAASIAACTQANATSSWRTESPGVYATAVGVIVDDIGEGPPGVIFVIDRICEEAGDKGLSELACEEPIPTEGREGMERALSGLAPVEFVGAPDAVVAPDGTAERDGVLVWLGPVEVKAETVRVGATYARDVSDGRGAGVNLKLHEQDGQWIVDGAAGLGGCPA